MRIEEAIKTSKFGDERHKASVNVLYTAYWLKTMLSTALKEQDLTFEQHNVLRILKGSHPTELCVKDIGSRILEKSSNVPRIIDRLVLKKLVRRIQSKEDKRETLVSLTEKGISTIDNARKTVDEVTRTMMHINEEESAMLSHLLDKIRSGETH